MANKMNLNGVVPSGFYINGKQVQMIYINNNIVYKLEKVVIKVVNVSAINVRKEPSSNSDIEILGTLSEGDEVEVVSEENNWAKIKYGDGFAYVYAPYLSPL